MLWVGLRRGHACPVPTLQVSGARQASLARVVTRKGGAWALLASYRDGTRYTNVVE